MTTEAKVGALVLACLAVLSSAIIYLFNASHGKGLQYRTYLRYAGGLDAGSDVLFGGIEAGKITVVRRSCGQRAPRRRFSIP